MARKPRPFADGERAVVDYPGAREALRSPVWRAWGQDLENSAADGVARERAPARRPVPPVAGHTMCIKKPSSGGFFVTTG